MEEYKVIKNRQMELMLKPARERLRKYSVEELCRKGQISYDEENREFLFPSLGKVIRVKYPDYVIEDDLDMWHHLTILQYMDTADGSPLSGKWIGLSQMRGGLSRGKGFDKDIATMVERDLKDADTELVRKACQRLGGISTEGKADISMVIPYAPMFPVLFTFWEADDEFPPSGKVLVDENAEHYLMIEAAGGAGAAVVQQIIKEIHRFKQ